MKRSEMSQKIDNKLRGYAVWTGLSADKTKKGADDQHLSKIKKLPFE
jgi:hypothetical protein